MSVIAAREVWSQQSVAARRLLIEKLHGNLEEAPNDWAALSPQLAAALVNAMFPPAAEPEAPTPAEEHEEDTEHDEPDKPRRGRRGR
jgi:hypothetical protein